ncbi:hypothetical protein GS397_04750 [Sphingobium yanoikuyae]|uniref:FUSC family protein n=3 Tax=Sphingobium TaxID=165695 RepID=A0A6P1GDI9_SPHYA|nr:hypothetical protein GS397_04750 [Sphingobium yanoikuyae]QNG48194.1 FUSC family protein [Sphingobium yanoikuyae]
MMPHFRDIFRFNTHGALLAMPGFALLLVGGVSASTAMPASIAAGAAFSVGFGATKRVFHNRWAAMTLAGIGMTLVAFIGTILGNDPYVALAATALMGGLCGALISRDIDLWWVWLQIIIAFLLALHFPGNVLDGLRRALLVAGGSAIQIAAVGLMIGVIGEGKEIPAARSDRATRQEMLLHALRAALCITIAKVAADMAGIQHGYWAALTAMVVLKPGLRDTGFRGIERVGGTIAGILLATVVLHLLPSGPLPLAGVTVLSAGCAFGLQKARYTVLSAAITTSVMLMIALAGGEIKGAETDRLFATLIGGGVALAGAMIAPRRLPDQRNADDNE